MTLLFCISGGWNTENSESWDFDADSVVTMVRPSKSKELEAQEMQPLDNHVSHCYKNGSSLSPRAVGTEGEEGRMEGGGRDELAEEGAPVEELVPPQLGIDETAFVSEISPKRDSVVSAGGGGGKRGSVVSAGGGGGKRDSVISESGVLVVVRGTSLRDQVIIVMSLFQAGYRLHQSEAQSKSLSRIIIPLLEQVCTCAMLAVSWQQQLV